MRLSVAAAIAGAACCAAQAQTPIAVTGVQSGINNRTGARPARLNINDMYSQGGPAWDLYIQALAAWQGMNETDELSYFQVLGIHGLPFVPYNGVDQVQGGGGNAGYCNHNEILFGTWHRPFLAMYEQTLQQHVLEIAGQYTGQAASAYQAAAQTLRMPYWDWASDADLPPVATTESITIQGPEGTSTIRNPLYSYRFQRWPFTDPNFGGTIATYSQTMRCPSTDDSSAVMQNNASNANLERDAAWLKEAVYSTFTQSTDFATMVTDASSGSNFESPHNVVHNDVGCTGPMGHMTNLGWSGFDPIFMLHHTNVDRLIAMWQAVWYNNSMFTETYSSGSAIYATAANTQVNAGSPLKPFFDGDLKMHTSTSVASIRTFGYTYPEIDDWSQSQDQLRVSVISKVNALYGSGSPSSSKARRMPRRREVAAAAAAPPAPQAQKEYVVEMSAERSELELPCSVDLYLGDELAGTMVLLGMPTVGRSYGIVPLQRSLEGVKLPAEVVPFLQDSLRVEIKKVNGTTIPVASVPSLEVEVHESDIWPRASDSEFPTYGETKKWPVSLWEP